MGFIRFGARYYWMSGLVGVLIVLVLQSSSATPEASNRYLDAHTSLGWNGTVPLYLGCTIAGPLFMLAIGLLWPMLPRVLQRNSRIFLDVLCINQTNQELMEAGIYSLAGFTNKSKTLLVLWANNYFERKWCIFELASGTRRHQN